MVNQTKEHKDARPVTTNQQQQPQLQNRIEKILEMQESNSRDEAAIIAAQRSGEWYELCSGGWVMVMVT